MQLNPTSIPNKLRDAKNFLDYKELSHENNNHVYLNIDKIRIYERSLMQLMEQVTFEYNSLCAEEYGEFVEFDLSNKNNIKNSLVRIWDIPYEDLQEKGKFTVKTSVIQKLYERYRLPVLYYLLEYNSLKSQLSSVRGFTKHVFDFSFAGLYNNEGDRTVKVLITYSESDTFRFQSAEPNIQGLDRRISDILTSPKGWIIVFNDSRQIEPRLVNSVMVRDPLINFLIEEYGDVYYALLDYTLRHDNSLTEDNFNKLESLPMEGREVLKTMVSAGSYGSSLANITRLANKMYADQFFSSKEGEQLMKNLSKTRYFKKIISNPHTPANIIVQAEEFLSSTKSKMKEVTARGEYIAKRFYDRYLQHPNRVEYLSSLEREAKSSEPTVVTPFGDFRTIYGSYYHILNCLINNPFQMMSARLSAISIVELFEYMNSDERLKKFLFFGANFHDGDLVYTKKELIPHIGPRLQDFRSYEIEGWIPIPAEQKVYLDYKKDSY